MGCENYTPGHYFMKYLNKETQNGWSLNHEDATMNRKFFNGYRPRRISELTMHEMEMLKQTMLNHEAIFKKQVYELHQVYTVQRDLMNQLKKKKQFTYSLQDSKISRMASKVRQSNEADIYLQLPCNANINQKNIKEINLEEPTPSNINTKSPNSMKLSLGTDAYLTHNGQKKAELQCHKLEQHIVVDLNEPVDQPSDEELVISSSNCPGMTSQNVGIKNSSPRGLRCDFSQDINRKEGASSRLLEIEHQEKRLELQLFDNDGRRMGDMNLLHPSSWSKEKPAFSEHDQDKIEKYHQLSSPFWFQNDKIPEIKENPIFDREAHERNLCFPSISYSREEFPSCFSVSSWPNSAIQVPQHPSFAPSLDMQAGRSKEPIQSSYNSNVKWKCHGDLFSKQNSRSETLLPFNGLHSDYKHGSGVSSNSEWLPIHLDRPNICNGDSSSYPKLEDFVSGVKHAKDLGLNVPSQNGSRDKFLWRNCTAIADSRGSSGTSSVGIQRIKSMQYHETVGRHMAEAAKSDKCLTSVLGRSWLMTTDAAPQQFTEKWVSQERNSKDALGENVYGFKNQIDLNNAAAELPDETQSTTKQVLSSPSAPSIRKFVLDIDLEVPASSEAVDHMVQEEKYLGSNQLRPVEVANNISTDHREIERQQKETIRLTAETLLFLSYETCRCSITASSHPQNMMKSADTLRWFADTIVSNAGEEASAVGKSMEVEDINSDLDDGMDFYESMTLKLSDTKIDENCIQKKSQDHENGKENGFASMLLTKTRKCQGKKRRQKRDFQKDILPGLSSLSRHEVTEDLQSFGELMKESGLSWRSCGMKRNGRNGQARRSQSRPRGASASDHIAADPLPKQSNTVLDVDGSSILGWGRTRRCRRQRWPSGSIAGPLS